LPNIDVLPPSAHFELLPVLVGAAVPGALSPAKSLLVDPDE
jgi:hypothetical protein